MSNRGATGLKDEPKNRDMEALQKGNESLQKFSQKGLS